MAARRYVRDWRGRFAKVAGSARPKLTNRHSVALKADLITRRKSLADRTRVKRAATRAPIFAYRMKKMDDAEMAKTAAMKINSPERKAWIRSKWNQPIIDALWGYTGSSRELNGLLRGRKDKDFSAGYIRDRVKRDVPLIDQAMFAHRLDRDVTVHRVTRSKAVFDDVVKKGDWKAGIVRDRGYTGWQRYHASHERSSLGYTQSDESLVNTFGGGDYSVVWKATLPKGLHAIEIDNNLENGVGDEGEILTARDSTWKIKSMSRVTGNGGREWLEVELELSYEGVTNKAIQKKTAEKYGEEWIFGYGNEAAKADRKRLLGIQSPYDLISATEVGQWLNVHYDINVDDSFGTINVMHAKRIAQRLSNLKRVYPDVGLKNISGESNIYYHQGNWLGEAIPAESTMNFNSHILSKDEMFVKSIIDQQTDKDFHPLGTNYNPVVSATDHEFAHLMAQATYAYDGRIPPHARKDMMNSLRHEWARSSGRMSSAESFPGAASLRYDELFGVESEKNGNALAFGKWLDSSLPTYGKDQNHFAVDGRAPQENWIDWEEATADAFSAINLYDLAKADPGAEPANQILAAHLLSDYRKTYGKSKEHKNPAKYDLVRIPHGESVDPLAKWLPAQTVPFSYLTKEQQNHVVWNPDGMTWEVNEQLAATPPPDVIEFYELDPVVEKKKPPMKKLGPVATAKTKESGSNWPAGSKYADDWGAKISGNDIVWDDPKSGDLGTFVEEGAAPKPEEMKFVKAAGGSHGAKVYETPDGRQWLCKKQNDTMSKCDSAVARLQGLVLNAPLTFEMPVPGMDGIVHVREMIGDVAFGKPSLSLAEIKALTPKQIREIQKQHVLDWLVANHDAHAENWVVDEDGKLMGIDKTQSFKWFGKDVLDWKWRPNEHNSLYNQIYSAYVNGDIDLKNPIEDQDVVSVIDAYANLDSEEIKDLLRPYAEAAAAAGKLGTAGANSWGDPIPLKPEFTPNNAEAFLAAVNSRAWFLWNDFNDFFNRAKEEREKNGHPV